MVDVYTSPVPTTEGIAPSAAGSSSGGSDAGEHIDPRPFPQGVDEYGGWRSNTATIRERAMLWFINVITDKPQWWVKVHDETIVAKWKTELDGFVATGNDPMQTGFSDAMWGACMQELRDKAVIATKTAIDAEGNGGIVSVLDTAAAVFKADGRVPPSVLAALREAVKPFEDVPEEDKDWHPGSDNKVLDLVHPSLWPLVYGTSRMVSGRDIAVEDSLAMIGSGDIVPVPETKDLGLSEYVNDRLWSRNFQWLPADISFGDHGTQAPRIVSYINNVHPVKHKALYPVIEALVDASLPLLSAAYERVMSWESGDGPVAFPERKRIICDNSRRACPDNAEDAPPGVDCGCSRHSMPDELLPPGTTRDHNDFWDLSREWFNTSHPVVQPEPTEYKYAGYDNYRTNGPWFEHAPRTAVGFPPKSGPEAKDEGKSEKGAEEGTKGTDDGSKSAEAPKDYGLQVIVKLANIHLTPDKSTYDGGSWHFEGQLNEHICATALYYYDSDNVTDSRLAFRTVTNAETYDEGEFEYEQEDHAPFQEMYGMDPAMGGDSTCQELGSVLTREGRLLVFPNVLQHRVAPFELEDKTRPGHRKIVALFLVDPAVRIPSTANVAPQQRHWLEANPISERLPAELSHMVYEHLDYPLTFEQAKKFREQLIEERKAIDAASAGLMTANEWCFCEH